MNSATPNQPPLIVSHLAKVSRWLGFVSLIALGIELVCLFLFIKTGVELLFIITLCAMAMAVCTGVAAVVFAYAAAWRIKKSPAKFTGLNWAKTGHTAGSVGALLTVLVFLLIPNVVPPQIIASKNACINNLRQLDGAKNQWALELKKTATDTPAMSDLVGTDKYIKLAPMCPRNGSYTFGNMTQRPKCSLSDHTLP